MIPKILSGPGTIELRFFAARRAPIDPVAPDNNGGAH
jgi:hypothetical protein